MPALKSAPFDDSGVLAAKAGPECAPTTRVIPNQRDSFFIEELARSICVRLDYQMPSLIKPNVFILSCLSFRAQLRENI